MQTLSWPLPSEKLTHLVLAVTSVKSGVGLLEGIALGLHAKTYGNAQCPASRPMVLAVYWGSAKWRRHTYLGEAIFVKA